MKLLKYTVVLDGDSLYIEQYGGLLIPKAGLHKFFKNVWAKLKFYVPQRDHPGIPHWEPTKIKFHSTKIIRLGYLATGIFALLSYSYERFFDWTTWRPGFVHPCPLPMNDYSSGRPGDQDLFTPTLYLWTVVRLGDLVARICAPLYCAYERFFIWATWRPRFVHPCSILLNDFSPGYVQPFPITMNDYWPGRPGDQDLCTPVLYLWTSRYTLECWRHQYRIWCQNTFMA
jgi:hypothetical protein